MKKELSYSAVLFLALASYLLLGLLTELVLGAESWSDAPGYLPIVFGIPAALSVFLFIILTVARSRRPTSGTPVAAFKLTRLFVAISSVIIGLFGATGVWMAYSNSQEKLLEAKAAREQAEAVKRAQEAERQRLAAMTPEQRAADAERKRKEAEARAQQAAEAAAKRQAEVQARAKAEEEHKGRQLLALVGAKELEQAMKDPESFKLRAVLLMNDGTVCYNYRAKNSFGAELPGSAVLFTVNNRTTMLVQEQNGNRFVAAWNRRCANRSGEDLTALTNYSLHR